MESLFVTKRGQKRSIVSEPGRESASVRHGDDDDDDDMTQRENHRTARQLLRRLKRDLLFNPDSVLNKCAKLVNDAHIDLLIILKNNARATQPNDDMTMERAKKFVLLLEAIDFKKIRDILAEIDSFVNTTATASISRSLTEEILAKNITKIILGSVGGHGDAFQYLLSIITANIALILPTNDSEESTMKKKKKKKNGQVIVSFFEAVSDKVIEQAIHDHYVAISTSVKVYDIGTLDKAMARKSFRSTDLGSMCVNGYDTVADVTTLKSVLSFETFITCVVRMTFHVAKEAPGVKKHWGNLIKELRTHEVFRAHNLESIHHLAPKSLIDLWKNPIT